MFLSALPFRLLARATAGASLLALVLTAPAPADWPPSGLPLAVHEGPDRSPMGLTGPDGGLRAFWVFIQQSGTATHSVYMQRITIAGTREPGWPAEGRGIVTAAAFPSAIECVDDGNGGAVLVWYDLAQPAGVYAIRVDAEGAVMPGWNAAGNAVCLVNESGRGPLNQLIAVCPDGAGGAFIAWEDTRNTSDTGPLVYDVFAHHVLGNGTLDPVWSPGGNGLIVGPGYKYPYALVADGSHGFWLASENPLDTSQLAVSHFSPAGLSYGRWTTPTWASRPVLATDGDGGVFAAWKDCRACTTGVDGIYALRLVGAAQPAFNWPADGVPVTTAEGQDDLPAITATGDGAAMIAWRNDLTGGDESFRARRIEAGGQFAAGWSSPATFSHIDVGFLWPLIAPDGAGGAMFAFRRNRPNVFGSSVNSHGVVPPAFPDTGLSLCSVTDDQDPVALVWDGMNGAYVLWEDRRNDPFNSTDVYVMRFTREGVVGSTSGVPLPPPGGNPAIRMSPPAPNPASGWVTFTLTGAAAERARVEVLDLTGRRIVVLFDSHWGIPWHPMFVWDGRDADGRELPAGVYLIRATAGSVEAARRIVRIR